MMDELGVDVAKQKQAANFLPRRTEWSISKGLDFLGRNKNVAPSTR
jgi:hypothetical protein